MLAVLATLCGCYSWMVSASPVNLLNRGSDHHIKGVTVVEVMEDQGFWFGNFIVGDSKNLSLLVDTGSADVGLNSGEYKPSHNSVNLKTTGQDSYGTTQSNGCGNTIVCTP